MQVVERALFCLNSDHILQLVQDHSSAAIPILFPALSRNLRAHWNRNIHKVIMTALKVSSALACLTPRPSWT